MKRSSNDKELVQSLPKSCSRNQNGNQPKLQIDIQQKEHKVNQVVNPKGGHVKLQKALKVTVLSVKRFARASWYSMNGHNDYFSNRHKIVTRYLLHHHHGAADGDQPTVH